MLQADKPMTRKLAAWERWRRRSETVGSWEFLSSKAKNVRLHSEGKREHLNVLKQRVVIYFGLRS